MKDIEKRIEMLERVTGKQRRVFIIHEPSGFRIGNEYTDEAGYKRFLEKVPKGTRVELVEVGFNE